MNQTAYALEHAKILDKTSTTQFPPSFKLTHAQVMSTPPWAAQPRHSVARAEQEHERRKDAYTARPEKGATRVLQIHAT